MNRYDFLYSEIEKVADTVDAVLEGSCYYDDLIEIAERIVEIPKLLKLSKKLNKKKKSTNLHS